MSVSSNVIVIVVFLDKDTPLLFPFVAWVVLRFSTTCDHVDWVIVVAVFLFLRYNVYSTTCQFSRGSFPSSFGSLINQILEICSIKRSLNACILSLDMALNVA